MNAGFISKALDCAHSSKLREFKTGLVIVDGNKITIEFEENDCNGHAVEASGQDGDQLVEVKLIDFSTRCTRDLMPHALFLELKIIDSMEIHFVI